MSVALMKSRGDVVQTRPIPTRALWMLSMVAAVLVLPLVMYAFLAYRQFGLFNPSYFIPYEEMSAAFGSGDLHAVFDAPLISVNVTSGLLLSNMFSLSVGQFFLSVALGATMGLTLDAQLSLRKVCELKSVGGSAAAAGSGLVATLAASGTGILGCCGSGLTGGILLLAGVSSITANQIAEVSPFIQAALIALFALAYLRFSRRLKTLATPD
jgi:hypothetical protein